MASGEHMCELYARHAVSADVCIVGGMMECYGIWSRPGLFGGDSSVVLTSSRAGGGCQVCRLFNGSFAVGFIHFRPDVRLRGDIQSCRVVPPL